MNFFLDRKTACEDHVKRGGKRHYVEVTAISFDEQKPLTDSRSDHQYWLEWLAKYSIIPEALQSLRSGFQAFWNSSDEADRAYQILLQLKSEDR